MLTSEDQYKPVTYLVDVQCANCGSQHVVPELDGACGSGELGVWR